MQLALREVCIFAGTPPPPPPTLCQLWYSPAGLVATVPDELLPTRYTQVWHGHTDASTLMHHLLFVQMRLESIVALAMP